MTNSDFDHRLRRIMQRTRVNGSAHAFRKTVTSVLYESDVRDSVIAFICGWPSRSVRARYYTRVADETMYRLSRSCTAGDQLRESPDTRAVLDSLRCGYQPQDAGTCARPTTGRRKTL
jgi:hypothetical protein